MADFYVQVVDQETGDVVRSIACDSPVAADRVERAVIHQMNVDRYYTQIVEGENANQP